MIIVIIMDMDMDMDMDIDMIMIGLLKCFGFYYVIFLSYYEENVLMGSL